jgi:hypothetical protein
LSFAKKLPKAAPKTEHIHKVTQIAGQGNANLPGKQAGYCLLSRPAVNVEQSSEPDLPTIHRRLPGTVGRLIVNARAPLN